MIEYLIFHTLFVMGMYGWGFYNGRKSTKNWPIKG